MVGADAQRTTERFRPQHQRRKRLVQAGKLPVVVGVRVVPHREFFLVGVVARVDADFFDVLHCFHRGARQKMNVRHERDMAKAGGRELLTNGSETLGGRDVGRGDAHDFAADLGQRDGLAHRGGDVLRVAGGHRLQTHGMVAADADRADEDFVGGPAGGLKARDAVAHENIRKERGRRPAGLLT